MSLAPPFTAETAHKKVKVAQDLWNTRDPERIAKVYTTDSIWRNRDKLLSGTEEITQFLTSKWQKEKNYKSVSSPVQPLLCFLRAALTCLLTIVCRLRKELFTFSSNKIAVQFWYEYQDSHDGMKWKRCYGLEDWTYDDADAGKMRKRMMSGNDVEISEDERWFKDGVDVNSVDISEKHW
ncbi:hypothetical protein LTR78_006932 [Recurvomyces mirabilis]|uniref:DUF1348-domain-containing protein n=1 Tax=Recurvomyces mirabilis TaxID=574656 RepID=A0AAE0WJX6_9PEZI|nr:hypothetical protein LTR78_006932 [Recurvomyces mirabilis]KAK5153316.1 hypothetical protein LTS14_007485 [Recurvomyces mirabilis]